MLLLQNKDHL